MQGLAHSPGRGAQLAAASSVHQKVASSIRGQDTHLGCGFDPRLEWVQEATDQCFSLLSLSLSLSPLLSLLNHLKSILG